MKRISTLAPLLFALPLAISFAACDLDKEDGADTGAVVDDEDLDMDDEDDDEPDDDGGGSSAGTGLDPDEPGDDDDSDTGVGTSDGDSDGDDDGDDSDTGIGGGDADGFAMLHGEIPDIEDGGGSGTSGTGGDSGIPEDALLVVLDGNGTATCEQPWDGPDCGANWRISFTLMPEMQVPGSYDLFDEAMGSFGFADEPHPEGDCAWGGGTLGGTLVIDAIDDTSVSGHIEDSDAFDFDADVSFVAPRC